MYRDVLVARMPMPYSVSAFTRQVRAEKQERGEEYQGEEDGRDTA